MNLLPKVMVTVAALAAGTALAQTAPAAPPAPVHTFTGNVGLYSEYLFRGIAQTAGKPALQGGLDYAHASGFYAGTWASNISWLGDFGAYQRSSLELDFYGGYKGSITDDIAYDVGLYYYYYPGTKNPGVVSADTFEGYAGLSWKWLSAKLSYNFDNYFGAKPDGKDTSGTIYLDISAAYPLGDSGVTLNAHYGNLHVKNDAGGDGKVGYDDYRAGVAYVIPDGFMKGVEVGAYYSGNTGKKGFYTDLTGYDTSKDRGVIYIKKTL